jgi:hypothetical protein
VVSYATPVSGWNKINELIITVQLTRPFAGSTDMAALEQHMVYCHIKYVTVLVSVRKLLIYKDLAGDVYYGSAVASRLLYCSA